MLMVQLSPVHNASGDYEDTGHCCGDQGPHCYGPEVFRSAHPGKWSQTASHDDHPDTEREVEACSLTEGAEELGDEDDEDTAPSVQGEGDAHHGDNPAQLPSSLLSNGGVGVPHLTSELLVSLLQHDPAEAQPRAGVAGVDGEEEDEKEAGGAPRVKEGAGQGQHATARHLPRQQHGGSQHAQARPRYSRPRGDHQRLIDL